MNEELINLLLVCPTQDDVFNAFGKLALPWREESHDSLGNVWYRRNVMGGVVAGPCQTYNRAHADESLIGQGYNLLDEE